MGLWEFLQQWRGSRATVGVTVSLLLHALVVAAVLWGTRLPIAERWRPKPGDALIVELPKPEEPASAGSPSAPPGPVTPQAPPNPVKTPPPAPPARPAPPAPRQVAATPRAPEPSRPAPRPSEPPRAVDTPPPVDTPRPAEPARPAPPRPAEPADTGTEKAVPSQPSATAETPRVERVPPAPRAEPGNPQVASVPPGGAPSGPAVPDMRSALRRGGGGRGEGRGGILGDPVPLDTPDPKFHEFLNQVRKQIQDKLTYPCIKHPGTFECEPKDTEVIVHFGILKTGRLQFIDLYIASPWSIYDDASMNAIRLAQPFPPVPAAIMAALPAGSTGMPIAGRFRFQVTYSTLVR